MNDNTLKKIEYYSKSIGFQDVSVAKLNELSFYSKNLQEFIKALVI